MRLDRILMPTDFSSCANAALTHAVVLARQFEADLHFLHVSVLHQDDPNRPGETFPGFEELHRRWTESAAGHMKRLLAERPTRELTVFEAQSRDVAAAPPILDYADRESIDLIVLGTHGRRGLRHFLLGSVAEEVVRKAACPVLTIRDEEEVRRFHELERIVVPFDFSDDSKRALEVAAELAATYGSGIDVVHVVLPSMQQAEAAIWMPNYAFDHGETHRRAKERLGEVVDGYSGVPIRIRILDGPVVSTLTRYAEGEKADLIVIASHGLSGIEHFLLGSVAERVIRSAACPVLTIKRPASA